MNGTLFDDFLGLEGRGGVVMNSNTADNDLLNSLIQDNDRFGIIDRGNGNTFLDVIERRNGE